ncbi:MAG: hypothetical protein V4516_10455, partial [Pseudomonadota bacterium]
PASGSEGASVTFTTTNSVSSSYVSIQYSGWQGTPEKGTAAGPTTSTNADSPAITPSTGSDSYTFIAVFRDNGTVVATVAPTNYGNLKTSTQGTLCISTADRALTASTEDPSTFTSASVSWFAQTYSIRGAAAGFFSRYYYDMNRAGNV